MAIGPEFDPQGNAGTPVLDAGYRAVDYRQSMMQKAQQIEQQKIATQMLEAKRIQWEVEAPLRQRQFETNLAEEGNKLYAAKDVLDSTLEFETKAPEFIQMMKEADVVETDEDGDNDYSKNYQKWAKIASSISPYSSTVKGKRLLELANFNQVRYASQYGNILDLKEKRIAKLAKVGELKKAIIGGRVMDVDPTTGEMAPHRGAYETADEAADKVRAQESAKQGAKHDQDYMNEIELAGNTASQDLVAIQSVINLLKSGNAQTGYGQTAINTFYAIADQAGIPIDSAKLQNNQYTEQQMNLLKVKMAGQLMRGQGQITEKEREMLEKATASVNWLPETNIRILTAMAGIMQRNKQLNTMKLSMERDGKSPMEIRLALEQYKQDHDQGFDIDEKEAAGDVKSITRKSEFDALPKGAKFIFNGKVGTKK